MRSVKINLCVFCEQTFFFSFSSSQLDSSKICIFAFGCCCDRVFLYSCECICIVFVLFSLYFSFQMFRIDRNHLRPGQTRIDIDRDWTGMAIFIYMDAVKLLKICQSPVTYVAAMCSMPCMPCDLCSMCTRCTQTTAACNLHLHCTSWR